MSERNQLDPAKPDNTEPRCNMQSGTTGSTKNRCGREPETVYRLPDLGLFVFVCETHAGSVPDLHPNAEEVGL